MNNTIVAVATPLGSGGIGVIRVSGKDSFNITNKFFSGDILNQTPNTIKHGNFFNSEKKIIDDVLVSKFAAPFSYTGEDVIEISCHCNMVIMNEIINTLLSAGISMAAPGEFTKRAFLNGKLDLSQAEAVNDLIKSSTLRSKDLALNQLKGSLGKKMKEINCELMNVRAEIEASIDFPEDVEEPDRKVLENKLNIIIDYIENLIKSNNKSHYFRDGYKVSIVGCVNVGKSSILNSLLNHDRAIVTDIPGTTRDVIIESLDINGIPVVLYDTAGVRETDDTVEKIGVEKSISSLENADLIMVVFDGSKEISVEDKEIISKLPKKDILFVINKRDIAIDSKNADDYANYLEKHNLLKYSNNNDLADNILYISTNYSDDIKYLKNCIFKQAGGLNSQECLMVTNTRHMDALNKALNSLKLALKSVMDNMEFDLVSIDLAGAMYNLGLITGETTEEDILEHIFSKFCIGK